MIENNWTTLWHKSKSDPTLHAALALLALNGLSVQQIVRLNESVIDFERRWITTGDSQTYPLVSYASEALNALAYVPDALAPQKLQAIGEHLKLIEGDAHRRLAGAMWVTDEENKAILETAGLQESPILPLRFTFPFSVADRMQPAEVSDVASRAHYVLQEAADWLYRQSLEVKPGYYDRVRGLLRQGSLVFLVASTGVSGLNLIHNILMGRLLSPADYSQLTFIITLQLLVGLLPSALQTVVARFSARYSAQNNPTWLAALKLRSSRLGWIVGTIIGALILLLSPALVSLFQLNDVWLLIPVIASIPFFVKTGVDRGYLQGLRSYFWLSFAYIVEGVLRLGLSVILGYALLSAGRSLEGAVWGLAESMFMTWFIGWVALRHFAKTSLAKTDRDAFGDQAEWVSLGRLTLIALIGQALITNSDFLLVKNFFSPEDAGLYAAISVLGRIVYFGALPLTVILVPLIARRQALNEPTRPILFLMIGGGTVVCGMLIVGSAIFAPQILGMLYGDAYVSAANLLAPYAIAASLYTLTNLAITYQISLGNGGETWMPMVAGGLQIILVLLFHESLTQVILIQVLLMALLLTVVLVRVIRSGIGAPHKAYLALESVNR